MEQIDEGGSRLVDQSCSHRVSANHSSFFAPLAPSLSQRQVGQPIDSNVSVHANGGVSYRLLGRKNFSGFGGLLDRVLEHGGSDHEDGELREEDEEEEEEGERRERLRSIRYVAARIDPHFIKRRHPSENVGCFVLP